eukprot:SAG31_NODE_13059_length_896_cov_0.797992_2_plen_174_part_01
MKSEIIRDARMHVADRLRIACIGAAARRADPDERQRMTMMLAVSTAMLAAAAAAASALPPDQAAGDHGLTLRVFNNTALAGAPVSTTVLPSADFSLPASSHRGAWSAELVGTLLFPPAPGGLYNFSCEFVGSTLGFVWIDGHRVCSDGNAYGKDCLLSRFFVWDFPRCISHVRT